MKRKNAIIPGGILVIFIGAYFVLQQGLLIGTVSGAVAGLLFAAAVYFFSSSKIIQRQTNIAINSDESIIFAGGANHFLNGEAVGGKLYLLNDKLYFKSHKFNAQNHELQIAIDGIRGVSFYNLFGVINRGLEIQTTTGSEEKFVVYNRDKWKTAIEKIKGE
ncbi:MAG: hypothetical protein M3O71_31685 [Bacteroidota bacterium]|nr:hypothetical protein [Bacteroidota bacterium]